MTADFEIKGTNPAAVFALKLYRGEGMTLLAMNWKKGKPPNDFVGFAMEYKEPGGDRFYALKNRLAFPQKSGEVDSSRLSTRLSPIQMFRWVHFPRNADLPGEFVYRVMPVFMNDRDELSYGEPQEAAIGLHRETYPGKLNVSFTRGFVSSQGFVDNYESQGPISTLLPGKAKDGLAFVPTHPAADKALAWMGFEARTAVLDVLSEAVADPKAQVRVVAYDLNEPGLVSLLERLGPRLRIIIDDDPAHKKPTSAETAAAARLAASAGPGNVKRQHMGKLQHNKTITVDGPKVKAVVCGSTNFSWRGFYVQSNSAVVLRGKTAVGIFLKAFEDYWADDKASVFGRTGSAEWMDLGLKDLKAQVTFSPHAAANVRLKAVADDIGEKTASSLFYSLAFLYQTPGLIQDAIKKISADGGIFVYGISDRKVGGLEIQKPDGNVSPVYPSALTGRKCPEPFKSEPKGGGGNRMHHKFLVVDFNTPSARVYLGSYNFSDPADNDNGENLLLIRDRRIAISYMIEALRIFDHYHFRVAMMEEKKGLRKLQLALPPRRPGDNPWWEPFYRDARKIRDRELFA